MAADQKQLYNRQEYVVGAETQAKYGATDVLLVGATGLGCEIGKNLVLTGIRKLVIVDDSPLLLEDLSTNFFASGSDVGIPRSSAIHSKLAEMNRFVTVECCSGPVTEEMIAQHHVVVFVDHKTTLLTAENLWARKHNVKFVACESRGIAGCIFVDGGDVFAVNDTNGEESLSCIVTSITHDGTILCHEDKKHELEVGSKVYLTGVESPQFLNSTQGRQIEYIVREIVSPFGVKIECPLLATCQEVLNPGTQAYMHTMKKTETVKFRNLEDSLENPEFNFVIDSDDKFTAASQLHAIFRFAHVNDVYDSQSLKRATDSLSNSLQADPTFVSGILASFHGQLNPMSCIIGGLASQEALKLTSGKFTPLQQWFYFDVRELIPLIGASSREPIGTRTDGLIRAIGKDLVSKISQSSAFIVGAGALGCEHIKNAALLGFSAVAITDMDVIETSNLSRQFLFRNYHVGQLKSLVAGEAATQINPEMKIVALGEKVCRETESVFNEQFWKSQSVVLNALDNVPARLYVDERCLFYTLPLFESGTLGTKCNAQVVIPHLTESYGSSADPPEKSIPLCTLKHFPNAIEHTIQWARDLFHQICTSNPTDVINFLGSPENFVSSLDRDPSMKPIILKSIHSTLASWPSTLEDCIVLSRKKFDELYHHSILQLLHTLPLDKVNETGEPFWNSARKPPRPISFDPNDQLHVEFVMHMTALLTEIFCVRVSQDDLSNLRLLGKLASKVVSLPFEPAVVSYTTDVNATKDAQLSTDAPSLSEFAVCGRLATDVKAIEFEKDDDSNHHIAFITAASNLRASNYGIPVADAFKTKLIAGKIIPAMVTTTSLVTGFVMVEVLKYLGGEGRLDRFRNVFVNIALPSLILSDPIAAPSRSYNRPDGTTVTWTMWDRINVTLSKEATVSDVVTYLTKVEQIDVFMIALPSGKIMFSAYGSKKDLLRSVLDVARERGAAIDNVSPQVMLVVTGSFGDVEIDVPTVRLTIQ